MRLSKNTTNVTTPSVARLAPLGLVVVLLLAGCAALANNNSINNVDETVKTLIAAAPGQVAAVPSATHVFVALRQMTQEGVSEPMLTLTAFNAQAFGTLEHKPTPTPGPSQITLNGKPQFVEFNATWCGPCIQMKPAIADMQKKYGDQITFWSIDIDNIGSDPLVRKYQVYGIPYMLLLDKDGKLVSTLDGYQAEDELDAALKAFIAAQS